MTHIRDDNPSNVTDNGRYESDTAQTALLPCPFCGSDGVIVGSEGGSGYACFYATCDGAECFCSVGEIYDRDAMPDHEYRTAQEAAAVWNTRALQQPAPPEAEVKAAFDFIWEELADFIKECDVPDSYVLKVERSLKTISAAALQSQAAKPLTVGDGADVVAVRKNFEKAFREVHGNSCLAEQTPDGGYRTVHAHRCWLLWQKCWNAATHPAPAVPQAAVPDGWKLVPVEMPVDSKDPMQNAAFDALDRRGFRVGASDLGMEDMAAVYKAVVAASPPPPVNEGGE